MMTAKELDQFIEAVMEATRFSPNVPSAKVGAWRETIEKHGGGATLRAAIAAVEAKAA
jgi:hypothetical protein